MKKQQKAKELGKIARELETSACPLRKQATQAVPGEGNPDADVLLIGEAPGKNEDEAGRPFVGAAGKILDELLREAGLSREDVFITSIEKFRPPDNRDPKRNEIDACLPYLRRQLKIIQPELIITLGRHALQTMREWDGQKTTTPSMVNEHGKPFDLSSGWTIYPAHHPAAILYQRKLEAMIKKDFRQIKGLLKSLKK